jgi:prostaglandin-H2 D-isomerase / glutathione transferase
MFSFLFFFFPPRLVSNPLQGMPMNSLPCLQVDGKRVNQSLACCRYLGKTIGLGGADDWENLQIDTIADTVNDFRLSKD